MGEEFLRTLYWSSLYTSLFVKRWSVCMWRINVHVKLFPQKECESLLANCGENRLQSIGNEKQQQQQQQQQQSKNNNRKQKPKKTRATTTFFSFISLCFSLLSFYFLFLLLLCNVILGLFLLKKPEFWPARLSLKWLKFSLATFFKKIQPTFA